MDKNKPTVVTVEIVDGVKVATVQSAAQKLNEKFVKQQLAVWKDQVVKAQAQVDFYQSVHDDVANITPIPQ